MMRASQLPLLALLLACGEAGTGPQELPGDDRHASFGGTASKADGIYSECQLIEVLSFLNESTTDVPLLQSHGVRADSAGNILTHRLGPDGLPGTADDDIFDDFDEVDAVHFVGPATLDALVGAIADRCLDAPARPYIDGHTFADDTGGGWTRDNVELEATLSVHGITGQRLHAILFEADDEGRTGFQKLRKNRLVEAFTYEYGIDEMPWGSKWHAVRESFPYMALSIESGRFELDEEDGRREVSLGTDIMDDVYYDTKSFDLLDNGMSVRGRARWDDAENVRRLLIAAKFGGEVDEEGIKRAAKVDVRRDSPSAEHIGSLDADVMRGKVGWSGNEAPIKPLQVVYQALRGLGLLPDVHGREEVLLLLPQVHLRSVRSRFHFNEASLSTVQRFHDMGRERLERVRALAAEALAKGWLEDADASEVEALVAEIDAELSRPAEDLAADVSSLEALGERKVSAQNLSERYHTLAQMVDDLDREIAGNEGDFDDLAEAFRDFVLQRRPALVTKTTWDAFITELETIEAGDTAAELEAFNAFGGTLHTSWEGVRRDLNREQLKIAARQIEGAGTAALTLWFDSARRYYVPTSRRYTWNFLIDTIDASEMISHEEYLGLSEAQTKPSGVVPPEKVFHTTLVNEVQIELGSEKEYVARIDALKAEVEAGTAGPEAQAELAGARFVFGEYRALLRGLAELKGERIVDHLEDNGASGATWAPATASKGITALTRLSDSDD